MAAHPESISVPRSVIADILARAASAARLIGHSDACNLEPISEHVDAIAHVLGELLGDHRRTGVRVPSARSTFGPDVVTREVLSPAACSFDAADAFDDVRQLIAKVAALAHAVEDLSDEGIPPDPGDARRRRDRLAHLIGAAVEAADAALEAGHSLALDLSTRRTGA